MERMYLQFSFDEELCPAVKLTSTASLSGDPQVTVVQGLKDKVQKDLLFVADNLLNCYSPEVRM